MIVKNEAPVIRRCLDSVLPLLSHWVIVATGSTDGTQDLLRAHPAHLPGTLHERPWVDFAHNRSEALALSRPQADYSLVIDADDFLEPIDPNTLTELTNDCYSLNIVDPRALYIRKQLFHNRLPWRMRRNADGARHRDAKT